MNLCNTRYQSTPTIHHILWKYRYKSTTLLHNNTIMPALRLIGDILCAITTVASACDYVEHNLLTCNLTPSSFGVWKRDEALYSFDWFLSRTTAWEVSPVPLYLKWWSEIVIGDRRNVMVPHLSADFYYKFCYIIFDVVSCDRKLDLWSEVECTRDVYECKWSFWWKKVRLCVVSYNYFYEDLLLEDLTVNFVQYSSCTVGNASLGELPSNRPNEKSGSNCRNDVNITFRNM